MTKTPKTTKTQTRGAHHDVTKTSSAPKSAPNTQPKPARPTEAALRPTTPLEILVTRALDQELEWYFSYAESALARDGVGMLPSYVAVLLTDTSDAAVRNRAREFAHVVRGCLLAVRPPHAEVLRAVYTPRSLPSNVRAAFDCLAPIAVRMSFVHDPWPARSPHGGLEHAAAMRLSAALTASKVAASQLRAKAQALLGDAVRSYAGLRAIEGSTLGAR